MQSSAYTAARLNPLKLGAVALGVAVLAGGGSDGANGEATEALRVTMEAKPGREREVADMLARIRDISEREPGTLSWTCVRRGCATSPARAGAPW